jgi:hypothetical protein
LLLFSQDGHKGNGQEWSLAIGSIIICLVLKIEKCLFHCMSTTVTLCFDNVLQFNAVIVDFELAAMKVLKEIF